MGEGSKPEQLYVFIYFFVCILYDIEIQFYTFVLTNLFSIYLQVQDFSIWFNCCHV